MTLVNDDPEAPQHFASEIVRLVPEAARVTLF